jgi:predicted nucleic acid-binding protein
MRYLFDSNTLSDLYDKNAENHAPIFKLFTTLTDNDIAAVSILTIYEMQYALQNAPNDKQEKIKQGIENILNNFLILPLNSNQAVIFGILKKKFRDNRMINKENIKKHTIDIMLASSAINENYCLVSADKIYQDLKQFSNSLCVEDWTMDI